MSMKRVILATSVAAACGIATAALSADGNINPNPSFVSNYTPGAGVPAGVKAALDDPMRPVWERARDAARKPGEVVAFSGIKAGDKVAELVPGDGYYTRILSPVVGAKGKVYTVVPLPAGMRDGEMVRQHEAEALAAGKKPVPNPADVALAVMNISHYKNVTVLWQMLYAYDGQFGIPEQLDAVFTADAYHDVANGTYGKQDIVAENKAIFASIKPGGSYVIVDSASANGGGAAAAKTLKRADAEQVKKDVIAAGFVLDGESKFLAVSGDDHTKMAMTGAASDGFDHVVLRFKKPATASAETMRPKGDPVAGYYGNTEISNVYAKGNVSANRPRWDLYNADGTYEEMGLSNPLQEGTWYWDAAGHNCEIHEYPSTQRNFVVCHMFEAHKVGDIWGTGNLPDGTPRRNILIKGHVYPPVPPQSAIDTPY